jgi:hypothetical protein
MGNLIASAREWLWQRFAGRRKLRRLYAEMPARMAALDREDEYRRSLIRMLQALADDVEPDS